MDPSKIPPNQVLVKFSVACSEEETVEKGKNIG
jgi:hypothetical protein